MKKINLAITGCMGRMGQQIIKSAKKDKNFKIVALTESKKINKKFDIIFLDADKKNYVNYLNIITNVLNKNGILITDNVLWYGKVLGKISEKDKETKAIHEFNKKLKNSKQFQTIILPLRDGISISIKL